jgi:DNA polymerase-3 subunit alpha
MEKYLKDTYGITVFQEQVMLQSRALAGFTRGESDTLRKAMGKKDLKTMEKLHEKFVEGCKNNPEFMEGCEKDKKTPDETYRKNSGKTGRPLQNTHLTNRTRFVMLM